MKRHSTPGAGGRIKPIRRSIGSLLAALAVSTTLAAQPASSSTSGELRHTRLYGIASSRSLSNVNRNDARAALKAWFDIIARQKGFLLDSRVDIAEDVAEIRERLKGRSVDIIALSVPEYLEIEDMHLAIPLLTHVRGARTNPFYSYLLLVNAASPATRIDGLRGKAVLEFSRSGSNTGAAWADVLLGRQKLGRAASFFASIKQSATAQNCILPVFFGSADACVVDEVSFNLAKEMNPQLGRLRILATSGPVLDSLIITPVQPHPYHRELLDALVHLHEDPRGRQVLLVFKADRLAAVQPDDLESARELWREYGRLPAARAGLGSAPAESGNGGN